MFYKTVLSAFAAALLATVSAQQPTEIPLVSVEQTVLKENELPRKYAGNVEAIESTDIMPRVTGVLLKTHFREGDFIQKGTLLYELEDTAYAAKVKSLEAQREALQAALVFAEQEFKRSSTLLKSQAASAAAYDKALFEINAARAKLKDIEAALIDAKNTLSYTKIYAPISGLIGKSIFSNGNLITPQVGKMTNITTIAPIYVRFSISEVVFRKEFGGLDDIRKNTVVRVQLADGSIAKETASVAWVDNKIHPSTNTITLWAVFQNKNNELLPGGFVTVHLARKSAKKMPAVRPSSLLIHRGGYSVYVIGKDGIVMERIVKLGRTTTDGYQIITHGLTGDELIITEGTHKVKPGMKPAVQKR